MACSVSQGCSHVCSLRLSGFTVAPGLTLTLRIINQAWDSSSPPHVKTLSLLLYISFSVWWADPLSGTDSLSHARTLAIYSLKDKMTLSKCCGLNIPRLPPRFPVEHSLPAFDSRALLNMDWRMKVMEDFEAKGCHFLLMLKSPHFLFRDLLIQFFFSPIAIPSTALPRRKGISHFCECPQKQHIYICFCNKALRWAYCFFYNFLFGVKRGGCYRAQTQQIYKELFATKAGCFVDLCLMPKSCTGTHSNDRRQQQLARTFWEEVCLNTARQQ